MEDLVTISIDGQEMRVPKGTLLWEAAKAHGIDIPIFCYHTKLGPVGACRTCLVEVEGMTKGPITACSTPATDGMKVRTRSPVTEKAQRGIFEFLLANHPLDCPICDRGGECPLQDQTFAYGPGTSRYIEPKRHHEKPIALGPSIALDRERCVLCWRCVRFCAEVAEDKSIVLLDRGEHTIVGTFHDEPYVSQFSGNVVELCPVGALTSRKQRFNFRPWELKNRPSICPHCAMGCNIDISVRKSDEVIRFLSRDNPDVDDGWLCDRGRFDFEFINSPERLAAPLIRRGDAFVSASWTEALDVIAERLRTIIEDEAAGPDAVVGVASPRLTNEDLYVFRRFLYDTLGSVQVDHHPRPDLRLSVDQKEVLERLEKRRTTIASLDKAKTILLLGADPSEREPVMELRIRLAISRQGARLAVAHADEIPLSARAHASVTYPRQNVAAIAQLFAALASSQGRDGVVDTDNQAGVDPQAASAVMDLLREGPVVVIYDDALDGVEDKAGALLAVADLLDALPDAGVLPLLDECNSMGARALNLIPNGYWDRPIVDRLFDPESEVRAALLLGANLREQVATQEGVNRLRSLDLLVVTDLFMTDTAKHADVVLPAASFAEKLGTFTNSEGRVQPIAMAVPSPGIARADWEILVDLSQRFDRPLDFGLPRDIWNAIKAEVPAFAGIDYEDIGPRTLHPSSALQPA